MLKHWHHRWLVVPVAVALIAAFSGAQSVMAGSISLPQSRNAPVVVALPADQTALNVQIFVGEKQECCNGRNPIAGRYQYTDKNVAFYPAFEFIEGQPYTLVTQGISGQPQYIEFTIPLPHSQSGAEITAMYPSADRLPANTLRFYLHFSTPMAPHVSAHQIKLLDSAGNVDNAAFMHFKQALWSDNYTRLTLLLDPGRIKRGVAQNRALGAALLEGHTYTIVVDPGWLSANGQQQLAGYSKTFSVSPALRTLPSAVHWQVKPPALSTTDPLTIHFDRAFDRQRLLQDLRVLNKKGQLSGTVSIEQHEHTWHFTPERPWKDSRIQIAVDTRLEDIAGNNLRDLLDHAVGTDPTAGNTVTLDVELKASH